MENVHNDVLAGLEGASDLVLLMPSRMIWGWREQVRGSEIGVGGQKARLRCAAASHSAVVEQCCELSRIMTEPLRGSLVAVL